MPKTSTKSTKSTKPTKQTVLTETLQTLTPHTTNELMLSFLDKDCVSEELVFVTKRAKGLEKLIASPKFKSLNASDRYLLQEKLKILSMLKDLLKARLSTWKD